MEREFKDSGIEWIGKIPKEWKTCRFKNFMVLRTEPSTSENKIGLENIESESGHFIQTEGKFDGNGVQFHKGEIVYGKLRPYLRKVWLASFDGNAVGDFFVFRNKNNSNANYLKWLLLSDGFAEAVNSSVYGAKMPRVSSDFILTLPYCIPPLLEQQRIADYLDKKCEEIDELIALQEQMIAQLTDYKQSVITEAVTKGLNPDAEFVPSSIDWIGDVPKGWNIVPLRYLGRTQNGISQSGDYFGEGFPFVSYSDVYKNYSLPSIFNGLAKSSKQDQKLFSVIEGDVFFTRTSETIDEIGFSSVCLKTVENAVFAGFLIRFRPYKNKIDKNFSKYYFRSNIHRAYFVKEMNLVTRASLSQELLKSLPVLLPPLSEQHAIATYLDTKCSEIDSLIAIKQQKIETLKDYKKSVIYEAVTGKMIV